MSLVQVLALKIERICARLDAWNEFLRLSGVGAQQDRFLVSERAGGN
jgi:hypothetical protein